MFEDFFRSLNVPFPPKPLLENKFTRWGGNNRYSARRIGDGLYFKDFKLDLEESYFPNKEKFSPEEYKKRKERLKKVREKAKREQIQRWEEAALKAQAIWKKSEDIKIQPYYLTLKKTKPIGIRINNNQLQIPLRDVSGKIWSLQNIKPNGNKQFMPGGKVKGCFFTISEFDCQKTVYVCEGYVTGVAIYEAMQTPVVVSFNAGNLEPVVTDIKKAYPNINIVIAADNDQWSEVNVGKEKAEQTSQKYNCKVVLPVFPDQYARTREGQRIDNPTDFNDLYVLYGLDEVRSQLKKAHFLKGLKVVNLTDFLSMDITPREMILGPIIPKQGVTMLYAYRGIGKTHVALGIAHAVATGSKFLKWSAPKARKVLYIDGEMPAISIQERLKGEVARSKASLPNPDYLRIISPDFQEEGIPSLSTPEGQEEINKLLDGVELVIVDNISTLCRGGKENESESWIPVQEWSLFLRRRNISILFIHHAGKNDTQRGNSKKEDIMDTVFALKRPDDYKASEGARFEVHYNKARGFMGEDAKPFEAILKNEEGIPVWDISELEDKDLEMVKALKDKGLTQRKIAKEIGFSPAKVNRLLKTAKEKG